MTNRECYLYRQFWQNGANGLDGKDKKLAERRD